MNEDIDKEDLDEYLLDSIKGRVGAKKKLAILNKAKLAKADMDDLFVNDYYKEDND